MAKTRILIADDHALMRIGLRSMLELQSDMVVVGDAGTGRAAVSLAAQLHPDVVIIDLRMPELDGAEATRQILAADPAVKVIVLSSFGASAEMARALGYGAVHPSPQPWSWSNLGFLQATLALLCVQLNTTSFFLTTFSHRHLRIDSTSLAFTYHYLYIKPPSSPSFYTAVV